MFFDLISRNSRRSRKENGLFFASLLISVIAFYIILSMSQQDVIKFLMKMESDAISRLLRMIPLFYGMTLLILFFLIYFASKYQLERRRHEFGVYLMLGMRRSRLFFLLLGEDIRNSAFVLAIGLPAAVLLSELISLVTARLTGLGIIGHRLNISLTAILWTAIGFALIKLAAFMILSGRIAGEEIGSLLTEAPDGTKKQLPSAVYALALLAGAALLAAAYTMAICGFSWNNVAHMGITLLSGFLGTLLFFFGLRSFLGLLAGRAGREKKLHTFTFRQLQENVIHRSHALAISSLLILAALCCFSTGVAVALVYGDSEQHVLDYTFPCPDNPSVIREQLSAAGFSDTFGSLFEMKVGHIIPAEENTPRFSMDAVLKALEGLPESEGRDVLLNNFSDGYTPRLIALSGYNQLLAAAGLPEITLSGNVAAVYMDTDFTGNNRLVLFNGILDGRPEIRIAGEAFWLTGNVNTTNLVVDRSITLALALIVPDEVFERMTDGNYAVYLNAVLSPDRLKGQSLLGAVSETNDRLTRTGIPYESYLQNIGRQLFYVVSVSYITIYLAIIFLIVANTVLGVQFLTQQQKNRRRYKTLIRLGAPCETLCCSAAKQIRWFFGIPVAVAAVSSLFGVRSLLSGLLPSRSQPYISSLMWLSLAMILLLLIVEYIYMAAVKKLSCRYLLTLMVPEREA